MGLLNFFAPKRLKLLEQTIFEGEGDGQLDFKLFKEKVLDRLKGSLLSVEITNRDSKSYTFVVYLSVKNLNFEIVSLKKMIEKKHDPFHPVALKIYQNIAKSLDLLCFVDAKLNKKTKKLLKGAKNNKVIDFAEHNGVVYFLVNHNVDKEYIFNYLSIVLQTIKEPADYQDFVFFFLPLFNNNHVDYCVEKMVKLDYVFNQKKVLAFLELIACNYNENIFYSLIFCNNHIVYKGMGVIIESSLNNPLKTYTPTRQEQIISKFNEFLALEKMKNK